MNFPRIKAGGAILCTSCKTPRPFKSFDGYKTHLRSYHGAKDTDAVQWTAPESNDDAGTPDSTDNQHESELPVPQERSDV